MTISVNSKNQASNRIQNPILNQQEELLISKPQTQELLSRSQSETFKNIYDQFVSNLAYIPDPHLKPVKIAFHYSGTDSDIAENKSLGLV